MLPFRKTTSKKRDKKRNESFDAAYYHAAVLAQST
jgi:hypothetical protein